MSEIKVNSIKGVSATSAAISINNTDGTCTANITNNLSNRNLIINGGMLISQRGENFGTLSSQAYTLDRWNVDAGVTVQQASLLVDEISADKKLTKVIQMQGASSDYFRTRIEDVSNFSNQTLTLSFYVKGSSNTTIDNIYARQNFGSGGSSIVDTAFSNLNYSVTTSYTRYTSTVTLPSISGKTVGTSSYLEIFMELPDGVTVYITGVQLEVGSVATDFEHRSFAQELILCQRYCQKLGAGNGTYDCMATGNGVYNTKAYIPYRLMTSMRSTPSFTLLGSASDFYYTRDGGEYAVSNITLDQAGLNMVAVLATVSTGISNDEGIRLYNINNTGGLLFTAEL